MTQLSPVFTNGFGQMGKALRSQPAPAAGFCLHICRCRIEYGVDRVRPVPCGENRIVVITDKKLFEVLSSALNLVSNSPLSSLPKTASIILSKLRYPFCHRIGASFLFIPDQPGKNHEIKLSAPSFRLGPSGVIPSIHPPVSGSIGKHRRYSSLNTSWSKF